VRLDDYRGDSGCKLVTQHTVLTRPRLGSEVLVLGSQRYMETYRSFMTPSVSSKQNADCREERTNSIVVS
jgi:hypothetical protein